MDHFDHLFTPLQVGPTRIKNRIAVTAHNLNWDVNGLLTAEYTDYLARRAVGGAGLLICFGAANVHRAAGEIYGRVSLWDHRNEQLLAELATAAHRNGAVLVSQVNHVGRRGASDSTERPLLAPSEEPEPAHGEIPHELTEAEIEDIVASFADASRRLQRCGWDGVEITSFGGQLIEQFFSPVVNRRTDRYGGDFAGRVRLATEIVQEVRDAVGPDFLVGFRLTGDPLEGGIGLDRDDMLAIAAHLDALGAIDVFNVSGGTGATLTSQAATVPPDTFDRGCYLPLSRAMKERLSVPVLCAGRILDVEQAERALARGDCDIVAMTRATIADPDLPRLAAKGRADRIRPCTAITDACIGRGYKHLEVRCAVNPVLGHPELDNPAPVSGPRRVVVVGGGPAGMEAARVAATRGHMVSLFEAGPLLGGQITSARNTSHRPHLGRHVDWLARELEYEEVRVELDHALTPQNLRDLRPDAVIVATGAESVTPFNSPNHVTDLELLDRVIDIGDGDHLVVYDREGGIRGGLAAITAAERGARVEFLTPLQSPCQGLDLTQLPNIRRMLAQLNVRISVDTEVVSANGTEVAVRNVWSHAERVLAPDRAVFVGYRRARSALAQELGTAQPTFAVHTVGDCVAPRTLRDAVREGAMAGNAV